MTDRLSPQIMMAIGMCALLASLAVPVQAQTYNDRRTGAGSAANDIRRETQQMQQRRALESMRQSQDAQARARATEDRQRELKRETDQLSKPLR
jgi:hypothetical protein